MKMEPSCFTIRCPISIYWNIEKAQLEEVKASANGSVDTLTYDGSNLLKIQYLFALFPDGSKSGQRGETRIYLYVDPGDAKEVKAEFSVAVSSVKYSQSFSQIYKTADGYGSKLCDANEFFNPEKGYFVNDKISLKINGFLEFHCSGVTKIPVSMKWTIKESDLQRLRTSRKNAYLQSKSFGVSNSAVKYHLTLFPNGQRKDRRGKVVLFLSFDLASCRQLESIFTFSVDSAQYTQIWSLLFVNSNGQGSQCCTTEELFDPSKGFIVNGEMVVRLHGYVLLQRYRFYNDLTIMKGVKGIATKRMRAQRNKFFTIVVDQKTIKVQKKVLIDASPVFAGMFGSGMERERENENQIEIFGFSFEVVSAAINLIYSTGISREFSFEDMISLLHFSDTYGIRFMKDHIEEYLIKFITVTNVSQLTKFSVAYNASKLYEKCVEFLLLCSKNSTPVTDLEMLDEDIRLKIFMRTFSISAVTEAIDHKFF